MKQRLAAQLTTKRDLHEFRQVLVILYLVLQFALVLILVLTHIVQTDVISDEIYDVLFQRILVTLLELVKLLLL